ncbi:pentapeptide repeat-containing protein [Shewanella frigidimarina]|uniref:pentapeptide repeat-containing protein n=1 Tax=Shewanella frigidimarina TaxID=56812 RepID=UPI003D79DB04
MNQKQLDLILSQHKLWLETDEIQGQQANFSRKYIEDKYGKPTCRGHRVTFYDDGTGLRYLTPTLIRVSPTQFELENERYSYFTGLDFYGATLDLAIFEDAIFYDCNMTNVSITKSDLSKAKFGKVILKGAHLGGLMHTGQSNLESTYSNLSGAYFVNCDFSGNWYQKYDFTNSVLTGSSFENCKLLGADFSSSTTNSVNFSNAELIHTKFNSSRLEGSTFIGSDLSYSDLSLTNISKTNFSNANLNGAIFKTKGLIKRIQSTFSSIKSKNNYVGCRVESSYGNERLKKSINEEVYIEEFAKEHPHLYKLWLISSDCGRSIKLWLIWSLLTVLLFAATYYNLGCSGFSFADGIKPLAEQRSYLLYIYYSIVTFTTLGFGDITPVTIEAMAVVVLEVTIGFTMLGLLISILANKVASRS